MFEKIHRSSPIYLNDSHLRLPLLEAASHPSSPNPDEYDSSSVETPAWKRDARPYSRKVLLAVFGGLSITAILAWLGASSLSPATEWATAHLGNVVDNMLGHKSSQNTSLAVDVTYSDEFSSTLLPEPHGQYRWSVTHASVIEGPEEGESFLETLAFIEKEHDGSHGGVQIVTTPFEAIVESAECVFSDGATSSASSAILPDPSLLLIRCHIPSHLLPAKMGSSVSLNLLLREGATFNQNIPLKTAQVAKEEERQRMAICISPMYGHYDPALLTEWRLHHAWLGVETIHWYYRTDENLELPGFLEKMNRALGTKDTFTPAPPVSPTRYGVNGLRAQGMYQDQTIWYADCIAKSRHTYPTQWISLTDLDEYFIPAPFDDNPREAFETFLDDHLALFANDDDEDSDSEIIGSICISRTSPDGPSILPEPKEGEAALARLAMMSTEIPASQARTVLSKYATKCIHRANLIELPWIHWAHSWRTPLTTSLPSSSSSSPGSRKSKKVVTEEYRKEEWGVPKLLHLNGKVKGTKQAVISTQLSDWVKHLGQERDVVEKVMSIM